MAKAVLFDLDNTLYDYGRCHRVAMEACLAVLKRAAPGLTRKAFVQQYDEARREVKNELIGHAASHNRVLYFQRLVETLVGRFDGALILRLNDAYWRSVLGTLRPRAGVLRTFRALHARGIKIVIVTNLTARVQIQKLRRLGISRYVDSLVTSEEVGMDKPNPEMFLLALNKAKARPEEALMVGDSPKQDIEGANQVGLTTVLLAGKHDPGKGKWKPDHIIGRIDDVLRLL